MYIGRERGQNAMIGDVYDYNKDRVYIMSGEKRIIINFKDEEEYQHHVKNGLSFSNAVEFDPEEKKIIRFIKK